MTHIPSEMLLLFWRVILLAECSQPSGASSSVAITDERFVEASDTVAHYRPADETGVPQWEWFFS